MPARLANLISFDYECKVQNDRELVLSDNFSSNSFTSQDKQRQCARVHPTLSNLVPVYDFSPRPESVNFNQVTFYSKIFCESVSADVDQHVPDSEVERTHPGQIFKSSKPKAKPHRFGLSLNGIERLISFHTLTTLKRCAPVSIVS